MDESSALDWATLLAVALTAVAAMVALVIYRQQARIMNRTRLGSNLIEVVGMLQSPGMRKSRSTLYGLVLSPQEIAENEAVRDQIEDVAQALNTVGLMLRLGMLPDHDFVKAWDWSIVRSWNMLEPWIQYRRNRPGEPPDLWVEFENLAKIASATLGGRGLQSPSPAVNRSPFSWVRQSRI